MVSMKKFLTVSIVVFAVLGSVVLLVAIPILGRIKTTKENLWSIGIYTGTSPYNFSEPPNVKNPVITAADVWDVDAEFVADPFMIKHDGTWYMFFEVLNKRTKQGDIGMASSSDGLQWKYQKIVVDEPFHLSYPFVFEEGGALYMVPESREAKQLRLYKASGFPDNWELEKVLISDRIADHAIFQRDGTWWLLAGADPEHHRVLRLFFADSLAGPWNEHPSSPVVERNANIARPGGRALAFHDRVIRYAQDCDPTYGKELNAFDIVELTRVKYREQPAARNPVLQPGRQSWRRHGMHQLDAHDLGNGTWIACVDGYRKNFLIRIEY